MTNEQALRLAELEPEHFVKLAHGLKWTEDPKAGLPWSIETRHTRSAMLWWMLQRMIDRWKNMANEGEIGLEFTALDVLRSNYPLYGLDEHFVVRSYIQWQSTLQRSDETKL